MPGNIDPKNLDETSAPLFRGMLDFLKDRGVLTPGYVMHAQTYNFRDKDGNRDQVDLTRTLAYEFQADSTDLKFIIPGTYVGQGNFYRVHETSDILTYTADKRFIVKPLKNYVYKAPLPGKSLTEHPYSNEINNLLPFTHSKRLDPTNDDGNTPVIEKNLGIELKKIIDKIHLLSAKELIDYTIAIIRALQELHDLNITHRDVKAENIAIMEKNGKIRAKMLDTSMAKIGNGNELNDSCGTPAFMAPEVLARLENTQKSDIYSLGLVLFLLFGGSLDVILQMVTNGQVNLNLDTLFSRLSPLVKSALGAHQDEIKKTIANMIKPNPNERISLSDVLANFLKIKLDFDTREIPLASRAKIANALTHGAKLHRNLSIRKYTAKGNLNVLETEIKDGLDQIEESTLPYFIKAAGIAAFNNMTTKKQVQEGTKRIINKFYTNTTNSLLASYKIDGLIVFAKFQKNDELLTHLNKLQATSDNLWRHAIKPNHKIDTLNKFNGKYTQRINALNVETSKIQVKERALHTYKLLLPLLAPNPSENHLRARIRSSIEQYLKSTLTLENLRDGKRAAHKKRYNVVKNILILLNTPALSDGVLKEKISTKIETMKVGFFFGRSRSQLYQLVKTELEKRPVITDFSTPAISA